MADIGNELTTILTSSLLSSLANSKGIKVAEFDAILSILIKAKIAFDVAYSPGTSREAEAAQLTIYINPTTTLNFTINFQPGTSIFTSV